MIRIETCLVAIGLTAIFAAAPVKAQTLPHESQPADAAPRLVNTCLITPNVNHLVAFYEAVLNLKAERSGDDYAEFHTGGGVLAIFSAASQERYIPGSAEGAVNKSVVLEFGVANVGQEYSRLQSVVKTWVKPPTTQPWGTRSVYFRDPDGNLVDFFAPAAPRAK
jgi:catechol 2,3-dioxygenase-like lactoylglutathione lyase family enzyme